MSGGVDSAVAAARLLDTGHTVTAVHLVLQSADAAADAKAVADSLGVPFELWDLSDEFLSSVIGNFVDEYSNGRTPNPCLTCNRTIKFGAMLDRVLARGFDGLATGHYARLAGTSTIELHRAAELAKDQSYVLAGLTQAQLRRTWLPLGASSKAEVRAEAGGRSLPVAHKAESMDLCFIPDGDTPGWLRHHLGPRPGEIVDESGEVLGTHEGTYLYTIGQRRGLNLRRPAADGQPRFVIALDAPNHRVVVGPKAHLATRTLETAPVVWSSGVAVSAPFDGRAQVRAHGEVVDCRVTPREDGGIGIELGTPIAGVAPGQTAVVYNDDRVVVAGVIR